MNGLDAARRMRKLAPLAKILFISQEFSFDMVEAALELGASGCVHKLRVQSDLLPAIESVLRNKYFVSGVVRGGFGEVSIDKPAEGGHGLTLSFLPCFKADTRWFSMIEVTFNSFAQFGTPWVFLTLLKVGGGRQ